MASNDYGISNTRRNFLGAAATLGLMGALPRKAHAQTAPVKWRMPNINPTGDWNYPPGERLADLVRKMSNGRLDITVYPAGQLSSPVEIWDGVQAGLFECGLYASSYKAGLDPIFSIEWGVPVGVIPIDMQSMWTLYYEKGLAQLYEKAFMDHGIYWAGQIWTGYYVGVTTFPVNSVADLNGKMIRTVGAAAQVLEKLGSTTVFIPVAEVYTALSTGTIDGAWFGPAPVYTAANIHEVATHLVLPPLVSPTCLSVLVSPAAWDALSDDLKEIFTTAVKMVSAWNYSRAAYDTVTSAKGLTEKGMTVVNFTGDDLAAMNAAGKSVWDEMTKGSDYAVQAAEIINSFADEIG